MPLFEFVCSDCHQPFEELVRNAHAIEEVSCPACGSRHIKKKVSTFASKTSSGAYSFSTSSTSSCSPGGA